MADVPCFEASCGVDVVITDDQVESAVTEVLTKHKVDLEVRRYRFNTGLLFGDVRKKLPWVESQRAQRELDMQLVELLGPKNAEDRKPQAKTKAVKTSHSTITGPKKQAGGDVAARVGEDVTARVGGDTRSAIQIVGEALKFHKVGENHKSAGYVSTPMTAQLLDEHKRRIRGVVHTRFPPEPNGILHIGHAKAINFNFGYARLHGGNCFLRYDDTNPEKEEERFFTGIRDMVQWLGYTPYKVTHASDNFGKLYELAKELIRRGEAYVCHQRVAEIKGHSPPASPWRNRPAEESLALFEVN